MNERIIVYPARLTFKAIFRNVSYTAESIGQLLIESSLEGSVTVKESRESKFISYTVEAEFPSAESLDSLCQKVATLEGYMTMF